MSYRNFPLSKKSYFVLKVTPYLRTNFGSIRCVNEFLGPDTKTGYDDDDDDEKRFPELCKKTRRGCFSL